MNSSIKQSMNVKWIKSDSGNTYLCNVDAVRNMNDKSDENLRMHCIEESSNPQNN